MCRGAAGCIFRNAPAWLRRYLPFALELFAFYHLIMGMLGRGKNDYVQVDPDRAYHREQN